MSTIRDSAPQRPAYSSTATRPATECGVVAANDSGGYHRHFAEHYLLNTMGAPLRGKLQSNVFVDGANDIANGMECRS